MRQLAIKSEGAPAVVVQRVVRRHEPVIVELAEGTDDRYVLMRRGKPLPRREVNAYVKWSGAQHRAT